jgi:hypothetical protein
MTTKRKTTGVLHVSVKGPTLPREIVVSKVAILGMSGSGKTQTARKFAEAMMDAGEHIVVFAPAAGWWGLRSSADGKGPGYSIAVFGGDHGDAPLRPDSGAMMAAAVLKHHFNAIFDMALMSEPEMRRFATDFLNVLNRRNRQPIHIFMDEFDILCPQQKSANSEESRAAVNTTVRRGRIHGIGSTMVTQNPQDADKSVLNMADVVIAMRMAGSQTIDAVKRWVERNGSKEQMAAMTSTLPSLPTGQGWIWAPQIPLFEKVKFALCKTFDSSRTPSPGEKVRPPKVLAAVDMARLGKEIDAQVKEERENSPEYLKTEIERLRAELKRPVTEDPKAMADLFEQIEELKTKAAEADQLREQLAEAERRLERIAALRENIGQGLRSAAEALDGFARLLEDGESRVPIITPAQLPALPVAPTASAPIARTAAQSESGEVVAVDVTPARQRIMEALATGRSMGRAKLTKLWVAMFAGASPTSSSFGNNLGALRSAGLIEYVDGDVQLTEAGAGRVTIPRRISITEAHQILLSRLTPAQRRIMEVVLPLRGTSIGRNELAHQVHASPSSSSYGNNLGALRSLGMLDYAKDRSIFATADMFEARR